EHFAKLSPQEEASEIKKLDQDRKYIFLLTQCLGHFMVPVGSPVLGELAVQQNGLDPRALGARRLQALWALANLGESLKRFDKLPAEQQQAVLARLESASEGGEQAAAAKAALAYLKGRQEGRPIAMGVDRVIEKCADAEYLLLRKYTSLVATYWSGTE